MLRILNRRGGALPIAAAVVLATTPVAAHAQYSDKAAAAAVAAAKAKIDAAANGGASERAAEVLQRARASYDIAEREYRRDNENRAYHMAHEAAAYADLALATAELKSVEQQRDALRQQTGR